MLYAPGGRLRAAWRLALYLLALAAGGLVAQGLLLGASGGPLETHPAWPVVGAWATLAGAVLAHVLMLRAVERRPWADVGLGRAQLPPRALAGGALLGALAVGVPALLLLAAGLLDARPAPTGGEPLASWLAAAASMLAFMAPAALFEELVIRGYPFMVLRESAGALPALVSTSVVFGLLHLGNPGATAGAVAMVTLAGIFLGGVLLATGSLWAAWTAHLAWNWTLGALLHASVSGLPFARPGYQVVDAGPDWLTGGVWGPEGGAGAAAGMLGALALLFARRRGGRGRALSHTLFARPERRGEL